jgi:hypothetical protein
MKLPNGSHAVVDIEKLRDYCLSSQHPEGRHKSRVFLSALGITASDAEGLRSLMLSEAKNSNDAVMTSADKYGCRYSIDSTLSWASRTAQVRGAWIIKSGEDFPRLTSCYVLRGDR